MQIEHDLTGSGPSRVLALTGELDIATAENAGAAMLAAVEMPGLAQLAIDLAAVPFIDSTGVTQLVRAVGRGKVRGVTVKVINPRPAHRYVFNVLQLNPLLGVEDEAGAAAAA